MKKVALTALVLALGLAGCTKNDADDGTVNETAVEAAAENDTAAAEATADNALDAAGNAVAEGAEATGNAADNVADAAQNAA